MNARTKATLQRLESVEWFRSVGVDDTDKAIILSSWNEAVQYCRSDDWDNLLLEAQNQYFAQIWKRNRERANNWNQVVEEVKPFVVSLVAMKSAKVIKTHQLPKVFEETVTWDMLGVALEAEYADIYPPGFFASQAYWYVAGHFPCGWKGVFPEGTLIIY